MYPSNEDQEPLMHLGGYPVYATHAIVLFYTATMLVCTVLGPDLTGALTQALGFHSPRVLSGQVWRIFTYGLVNVPSPGFIFDMIMLVWFGRELERFFGRRIFLKFYGLLYLLTPVLFTVIGLVSPMHLVGETGGFAVFIAFASLYPGALMIFGITAALWAAGILGVGTLMALYHRDPVGLFTLWIPAAFAFGFVRYEQGRFTLPSIPVPTFGKKPKLRVLPKPEPASDAEIDEPMAEIDTLLDKIAKSGLASLSSAERAKLEKAREDLLKRGPSKR